MKTSKYLLPEVPGYDRVLFGEALRWYRQRAGLTQHALLNKAGLVEKGKMPTGRMADWERRPDAPNRDYALERVANALAVDIDILAAGLIPKPETAHAEAVDVLRAMLPALAPHSNPDEVLDFIRRFDSLREEGQRSVMAYIEYVEWQAERKLRNISDGGPSTT